MNNIIVLLTNMRSRCNVEFTIITSRLKRIAAGSKNVRSRSSDFGPNTLRYPIRHPPAPIRGDDTAGSGMLSESTLLMWSLSDVPSGASLLMPECVVDDDNRMRISFRSYTPATELNMLQGTAISTW